MDLNELRLVVAEMLDEAKKKKEKEVALKKRGASVEAYGLYDEAFDFSAPLGASNLYRQQGAANWGPYTSGGPEIDSMFSDPNRGATQMRESEERAVRMLVREVIENGLVPPTSAWAPLTEKRKVMPVAESAWDAAAPLFEAWYDKFRESKKDAPAKKPKGFEKDRDRGPVKKRGQPADKKSAKSKK